MAWEYLALTGEKLNGPEMIACGLATHYAPSAKLPLIEEGLGKLVTDDPSVIEASLEQYGSLISPDNRGLLQRIETLDKCFSHGTVEEIIDALWNPPSLEEVSSDMVDQYFSPISELEPELELPTTLREAFT
uniref:3-hydroxyisobutyryl-CoA hydrolase n=1 Tax=Vitis vinifera TaxID=29760 RepID=A5BNL3_VITVI|nr:hypothetical protein VITISV_000073 [Vitis vinifera]